MLRAVAKHSPQLAQSVVDCGALDALVICLEEFDPGVKEAAAWALGYIARHNAELAQAVSSIVNWRLLFRSVIRSLHKMLMFMFDIWYSSNLLVDICMSVRHEVHLEKSSIISCILIC